MSISSSWGKLVVVDRNDKVLRLESRDKCQEGKGILHRAFSVYIFNNKGELLIQKRSKYKELWPLYWAPSCCSHPSEQESYVEAGERRLKEELGFTVSLRMVGKFIYQARYKKIGSENEMCAILVGKYDGKIKENSKEVAESKWVNPYKIDFNKGYYAPWFEKGLKLYLKIREKNHKEVSLFLSKTVKQVDPVIKKLLEDHIDKKFHQLIDYQVFTGGKRLRPALVIACSNLLGGSKNVLYPAAGLEILHNSTLIVDDIIDHSKLRRKQSTVWFKFGQSIAECMGLDYLAASFEGANKSQKPIEIAEIFANTLKTVIDGEMLDILFEQSGRKEEPFINKNRFNEVTKKDYYKMIGKKTAILTQACCEVGGIDAKASAKQLEVLKNYGFNLGLSFQIRDDILDIFGEGNKFGKKIGKDIEERKLGNIIILLALGKLKGKDREDLLRIMKNKDINNKDIKQAIELIKKTNSKEEACSLADEFADKAKESLEELPKNKWNNLLNNLVDFVVQREN
jgi:geranylgeranyl diphosphate synthase type I